jgi:hypothetical protein
MFVGMTRFSRWLMRGKYRRATIANIVVDASGAATIPVLATFTGVGGLPWWYGIAVSNAKLVPVLELDAVRFRVVRTHRRRFGEIACVDIRQATGTVNLALEFHGALLTFTANLGAVPLGAHVLRLFPAPVPLTTRAAAIRDMPA